MRDAQGTVQTYGFALAPNFALMSYAAATEPLRAANLVAQAPLYAALALSAGGRPVRSSAGFDLPCADLARRGRECHTVFVVAGGGPADWAAARPLFPALRRLARTGVRIGGISAGSFLLAEAGLLGAHDFTIHWEHAPALMEAFPLLQPRQARFVIDGDRLTCGGGIAPLDMMHALIAERMGSAFAQRVSDWFLHASVAEPAAPQRAGVEARFGARHPAVVATLDRMEASIERPLARGALARLAGISDRHLDRLFAAELGTGLGESYRAIRLDHARRLLEQSPLAIAEIAAAAGFSSAAHFSRAFRRRFGLPPKSARAASRAAAHPPETVPHG